MNVNSYNYWLNLNCIDLLGQKMFVKSDVSLSPDLPVWAFNSCLYKIPGMCLLSLFLHLQSPEHAQQQTWYCISFKRGTETYGTPLMYEQWQAYKHMIKWI